MQAEYISFAYVGDKQYAYIADPNYYNIFTCSLKNNGDFDNCSVFYNGEMNNGYFAITTIGSVPYMYYNGGYPSTSDDGIAMFKLSTADGSPSFNGAKLAAVSYDGDNIYQYGVSIYTFNGVKYAYTLDTISSTNYLSSCPLTESGVFDACSGDYALSGFSLAPFTYTLAIPSDYSPYIYVPYYDSWNPTNGGVYKCTVNQTNGKLASCDAQSNIANMAYYDIVFSSFAPQ